MRPGSRMLSALVLMLALAWGPFGTSLLAPDMCRHAAREARHCCPGANADGMCPRHKTAADVAASPQSASASHLRCECSPLLRFIAAAGLPISAPVIGVPADVLDTAVA